MIKQMFFFNGNAGFPFPKQNVLFLFSAVAFVLSCDNGWVTFRGSCYLFVDDLQETWSETTHQCSQNGATLVSVESPEEDLFLQEHAKRLFDCGRDLARFWLGGTDDEMQGIWKWQGTNQTMDYTNWAVDQPQQRPGELCLVMFGFRNFSGWDD